MICHSLFCAILNLAKTLLAKSVSDSGIDILSDSQASLKALANPDTVSDLVRNTKTVLNELGAQNSVALHYIEAHKGWKFNELADKNAKKGADMVASPENTPSASKRSLHNVIECMINEEWLKLWEKDPACRQAKYFIMEPSTVRARLLLQNDRETLGRLVRYLTGHAFLRVHNAIVLTGLNPPPGDNSCRLCEDKVMKETPHHIITECERLWQWRLGVFGATF